MKVRKFDFGPSLPQSAFLLPSSSPRALLPAGWTTVGEAIAWIGFGQAVPVQLWDRELTLGLSLWPWFPPFMVPQWVRRLAKDAVLGDLPYTAGMTPGHRVWLVWALRGMSRGRPIAGLPTTSAEAPDQRLRAEAAHHYEAWDETRQAEVSRAFLTATIASDELRSAIAKRALSLHGVPTEREGGTLDLMDREAIAPAVCDGPVTLTPDGLYRFVPDDVARSVKLGPSFVDLRLPARDLARVFPRTPGKAPDLLAAALAREPEPGEADAIAAQQDSKPELVLRTGTAGRPSSMHLVHPEHRRRIAAGEAHASLAAEARYLQGWLKQTHPEAPLPGVKALENAIRDDHPKHLESTPKMNRRS